VTNLEKQLHLTTPQLEVLRLMRDTHEELAYERGTGYVGFYRVHYRTLLGLQRAMVIRRTGGNPGGVEYYEISEIGREYLDACVVAAERDAEREP
jgi:DNA-binding PadR family transcriptional regulator